MNIDLDDADKPKGRNTKNLSLNLATSNRSPPLKSPPLDEKFPFQQPPTLARRRTLTLSIPHTEDSVVPATPAVPLNRIIDSHIIREHITRFRMAENTTLTKQEIIQQLPNYSEENFEELEQNYNAYPDGPICVSDPNLYLYSEPDLDTIRQFDLVINVAKEIADHSALQLVNVYNRPIEYHFLPWSHTSKISRDLPYLTTKIDNYLKNNKKVLVHCQCGVSRSASVIIGYFMLKFKIGVNEAYNVLKNKVDKICPNMSLIFELMEFSEFVENPKGKTKYLSPDSPKLDDFGKDQGLVSTP